jgi:DNA-binding transcriptional ArsR family regulator
MLFHELMKSRNDKPRIVICAHENGPLIPKPLSNPAAMERAARLFRALGDAPRLRLLHLLLAGEVCVGEMVTTLGEKFSTVSQRLRILRTEGLVSRRRDKSHVYYTLADDHVKGLVSNALAHADELDRPSQKPDLEDDK